MATELKAFNSYLIRKKWTSDNPIKITCKEVTQTSYYINWGEERSGWITKGKFETVWEIVEELDPVVKSF